VSAGMANVPLLKEATYFKDAPALTAAVRAGTSSLITQSIASVTNQAPFQWRAVAVSAIAAPVVQAIGVNSSAAGNDPFAQTALGIVRGYITQRVRMAVYKQGKLDFGAIAADAFGNALGEGLVDASKPAPTQGVGPWSDVDYRNGSDIESDNTGFAAGQARATSLLKSIDEVTNGQTPYTDYRTMFADASGKNPRALMGRALKVDVGGTGDTPDDWTTDSKAPSQRRVGRGGLSFDGEASFNSGSAVVPTMFAQPPSPSGHWEYLPQGDIAGGGVTGGEERVWVSDSPSDPIGDSVGEALKHPWEGLKGVAKALVVKPLLSLGEAPPTLAPTLYLSNPELRPDSSNIPGSQYSNRAQVGGAILGTAATLVLPETWGTLTGLRGAFASEIPLWTSRSGAFSVGELDPLLANVGPAFDYQTVARMAGVQEATTLDRGFRPAARTGLDFVTRVENQGLNTEVELLSKQRFDRTTGEIITSRYARSNLLGRLREGGDLFIDWYETNVPGRGVGTEMLSRAIESVGPQNVNSVSARFGLTNKAVFDASRAAGLSYEEAAWATPLGKSMRQLGFTNANATFNGVTFGW